MSFYYRGLTKQDLVDSLYNYYLEHQTRGIRISKRDLNKFKKAALARAHTAITNYDRFPRLFINIINQKRKQISQKEVCFL